MSLLEMITPINAKVQLRYMLGIARYCLVLRIGDFGGKQAYLDTVK